MKSRIKKYWYIPVLLLIMIGAAYAYPPVFYLNDDITMRSILSGAYTGVPDGHAVYMQYPLTGLLALLYRMLPSCPWMDIFFCGCILICMILVAGEFGNKVLGSLTACVLFLPFFHYMHYTIVAALLAGTAIFLLCRNKKKIATLVLLWIAYMIRSQVGLLCLPFVAAALVWQQIYGERSYKEGLRTIIKYAGLLLIGLLLVAGIHASFYSSAQWQEYLKYNDSRTQLYDYTDFVSTDKYGKEPEAYGMTAQEYKILYSYNTMLENTVDAERMQEIAEKITQSMKEEAGAAAGLKNCVKSYYLQVRYSDFPYNYIWLAVYALLAVCFLFGRKWLQLGYLGILGVGRSSIWMYLIWKGRFPERVSLSLYMMELLLLMGMLLFTFEKECAVWQKLPRKLQKLGVAALLLVVLFTGNCLGKVTMEKVKESYQLKNEWNLLKEYCKANSEKAYLMDVFSSVKCADALFEEDASNLMLMGGWLTASPLAQERLANLGGEDAAQVLFQQEAAQLVTDGKTDVSWLEEYLSERFGSCKLEEIDRTVWTEGEFIYYVLP